MEKPTINDLMDDLERSIRREIIAWENKHMSEWEDAVNDIVSVRRLIAERAK